MTRTYPSTQTFRSATDTKYMPDFVIVATAKSDHWVDLIVYEVSGYYSESDEFLFKTSDPSERYGDTKDIAKADKFCELFVKWDGCSEWLFPEQIHLCGPSSMASMHHMMTECHRIALEMMGRKEFG